MSADSKLIINAAITGMIPTKAETPHVPVTIQEMTECVRRVQDAGASIVHLHARGPDGLPTSDGGTYAELLHSVRDACPDIITCVSLSGRNVQNVDQRAAALNAGPDMASLTLGSLNFPKQACANSPEVIQELASRIYAVDAVPELEVFEAGFINYGNYLIRKGVLRPPFYFNLILGSLGTAPLDLAGLGHMVSLMPAGSVWSVGGVGRFQLDANVMAMAAGGHVRVGLEDNIHFDRGRTDLADNARLVERVARIARDMGREPASPGEARQIIGLSVG